METTVYIYYDIEYLQNNRIHTEQPFTWFITRRQRRRWRCLPRYDRPIITIISINRHSHIPTHTHNVDRQMLSINMYMHLTLRRSAIVSPRGNTYAELSHTRQDHIRFAQTPNTARTLQPPLVVRLARSPPNPAGKSNDWVALNNFLQQNIVAPGPNHIHSHTG